MSLYVTVQVTKTTTHLEQIHQLTITNTGASRVLDGSLRSSYQVTLDGDRVGHVWHTPGDGALVLIHKAIEALDPT